MTFKDSSLQKVASFQQDEVMAKLQKGGWQVATSLVLNSQTPLFLIHCDQTTPSIALEMTPVLCKVELLRH